MLPTNCWTSCTLDARCLAARLQKPDRAATWPKRGLAVNYTWSRPRWGSARMAEMADRLRLWASPVTGFPGGILGSRCADSLYVSRCSTMSPGAQRHRHEIGQVRWQGVPLASERPAGRSENRASDLPFSRSPNGVRTRVSTLRGSQKYLNPNTTIRLSSPFRFRLWP